MESERRSMAMFRPSSSTCKFSSRVPNNVSMLGVISIFFFIQLKGASLPPACLCARGFWMSGHSPALCGTSSPFTHKLFCCLEIEPVEVLAPEVQATTIGFRVPPPLDGSQWPHDVQ